ncbi:hypothetical protein MalM25_08410 [Planctomycetes bacterium MalM25]|nr:hypothetical protein MalM25_08410 [Planctomycetes bacterium MalM25]
MRPAVSENPIKLGTGTLGGGTGPRRRPRGSGSLGVTRVTPLDGVGKPLQGLYACHQPAKPDRFEAYAESSGGGPAEDRTAVNVLPRLGTGDHRSGFAQGKESLVDQGHQR